MSLNKSVLLIAALVLVVAAAGAFVLLNLNGSDGLAAVASGNGRIEATEVNLATKMAGRLSEVLVQEGDNVAKGQILARMDTKTLEAELAAAKAGVAQAQHALAAAKSSSVQQQDSIDAAQAQVSRVASALNLAQKDFKRTKELNDQGVVADEALDQDRTAVQTATAQLNEAKAQLAAAQAGMDTAQANVLEAQAAIEAAQANVETIQSEIDDAILTAPLDGRVLYRLAEPGEVLSAGGAVLTLLDIGNVYMTLFLPTDQAGLLAIGGEARIVLDAYQERSIPARVSFVSPQAQFTPKSVETQTEREKLMFRVKVRVDPALLAYYSQRVKTGLPGVAYVLLDPNGSWPGSLPPLLTVDNKEQ